MHITWWYLDSSSICSPTMRAIRPETPVSASSNIKVGIESASERTDFIPSMILDASPPEAVWVSGRKSSPGFVMISNSIKSNPFD